MHLPSKILTEEDVRIFRAIQNAGNAVRRQAEADALTHTLCACGKKRSILDCGWLDTGMKRIPNNLCPDCEKNFAECVKFVCVRCLRIIGFVEPHKTPDGFIAAKRAYLHIIGGCTQCTDFTKGGEGTIAEKLLYNRRRGK